MLELIEITTSMHALDNDIATYQRQGKIIDGIFTCHSIERKQSGYLPFRYFPSDHRALCIDINYHKAFGFITIMCQFVQMQGDHKQMIHM